MTTTDSWLDYNSNIFVKVARLETTKIHINNTINAIYSKGEKYTKWDIGNMYTTSQLEFLEFIRINIHDITNEVIKEYNQLSYVKPDF